MVINIFVLLFAGNDWTIGPIGRYSDWLVGFSGFLTFWLAVGTSAAATEDIELVQIGLRNRKKRVHHLRWIAAGRELPWPCAQTKRQTK